MKVSLERSIGIPTIPYAPVKVVVAIEGEVNSPSEVESLSKKLDAIMAIEIIKTLDESVTISEIGYKKYLENMKNMYNEILNDLEE